MKEQNSIGKLDPNLRAPDTISKDGLTFYSVRTPERFSLHGFCREEPDRFLRIPQRVADTVSEGVAALNACTAGGRVRFRTDSKRIAVRAELPNLGFIEIMSPAGTSGFDLYEETGGQSRYCATFKPPMNLEDGYESSTELPKRQMRNLTVNFPLYNGVEELYIGVEEGAELEAWSGYQDLAPILYYGSSITQGASASRPGLSYEARISRKLNCDYRNLGFSGNAKGEPEIASYIAGQEMCLFVCDYDHNAPTVEHLERTYPPLYETFRKRQPETPMLMITRPNFFWSADDVRRRDVVYRCYQSGLARGDQNLYFLDGSALFGGEGRDDCTVDGCHPNDIGFERMASAIGEMIRRILFR